MALVRLLILCLGATCSAGKDCAKTSGPTMLQMKRGTELSKKGETEWFQTSKWFEECLPPFIENGYGLKAGTVPYYAPNASTYDLYLQPSGLCQNFVACAYQGCTPPKICGDISFDEIQKLAEDPQGITTRLQFCPPDNLPAMVVQAETVKDVVDGIGLARLHHRTVSVKVAGHNYAGSSTFKGSVNINMARYKKYSKTNLVECENLPLPSNVEKVCKLAAARGKKAVIRVGGGENWNEVYSSVFFLLAPTRTPRRYHVVGGAAGTVSAAGGWLQGGGLAGSTGMRIWGFGVDQVLQIEMVLSNQMHVRFMPSEWETVPGKLYPQTKKVTGECNQNVDADESKWKWEACESFGLEASFEDLWRAVRGGGGGTYGVVTSVYIQLHEQVNTQLALDWQVPVKFATSPEHCASMECIDFLRSLWIRFLRAFFFPKGTEAWAELSKFCGSNAGSLDIFVTSFYYCHGGEAAGAMVNVWSEFVDNATAELQGLGLTAVDIFYVKQTFFVFTSLDYYPALMVTGEDQREGMRPYPTQLADTLPPAVYPDTYNNAWDALLPFGWLHTDRAVEVILEAVKAGQGPSLYILGGNTAISGDGMDAIPEFQRNSSFMVFIGESSIESLFRASFDEYRGKSSDSAAFPGGTQYNHISATASGPLKSDWTKACPDLSEHERSRQCISVQESVWGTDLLSKLETLKARADPEKIFQCFACVGFTGSFAPRAPFGHPVRHWCFLPTFSGDCLEWWDHDPAHDHEAAVASMEKFRKHFEHLHPETKISAKEVSS